MLLSQLIDAEEFQGLSAEDLREMLVKLDDDIMGSATEVVAVTK